MNLNFLHILLILGSAAFVPTLYSLFRNDHLSSRQAKLIYLSFYVVVVMFILVRIYVAFYPFPDFSSH